MPLKPFQSDGTLHPIATGEGLRRNAVRGAGASIAGSAGSFILGIGSVIVLARLLTPADFGIVTMVTTFSLLFRSFGLNGFTELIMQREEITHALTSNLFWIELGIGIALTLVFAASGPLLASFYHSPAVAEAAAGISLTIGFGCLGWIHVGLLQRAMRFRTTATISLIAYVLYVIVAITLAKEGWQYWALVWASVTQSLVTSVGAWLMCRWVPSWPRRAAGTGAGVKFAINVYAHFAFSYSTRNTDNLLVGWRYGARSLGFYKKAYDLFVLPETQLLSPLTGVVVSALSRVAADRDQFRRYFLKIVSVLALVGIGVGVDFALVGKDLIRLLLGPGWGEAGRIFALFGPGIGVMLLYNTHGWVHLSIGRPERWFRWGLLEFACTASLFLVALHWGPAGVALAWTTSYFLLMFPGMWYAGKPIGLGVGSIMNVIWKFFVASSVAGFATLFVMRFLPAYAALPGAAAAFLRMVTASLLFLGLYIVGISVLHGGLDPLKETGTLLYEMLPLSSVRRATAKATEGRDAITGAEHSRETYQESQFVAVSGEIRTKE